LPIQRLRFGKTASPIQSSGAFTLGKFECSGRAVVNGMPTSCRDVYRIGHIFNDFYSIKRNGKIEMVFCDFSWSPLDSSEFTMYNAKKTTHLSISIKEERNQGTRALGVNAEYFSYYEAIEFTKIF